MTGEPRHRRLGRVRAWTAHRPRGSRVTASNLVQAGLTVLIAVLLAAATLIGSSAADRWQQAATEQTKWSAATIEDLRHVYLDEAPAALEFALARARAREYDGGDAAAERHVLVTFRAAQRDNRLVVGDYELPGGGYAIDRRLADLRAENRSLAELDPEQTFESGNDLNRYAVVLLLLTVPLVVGFVVLDLILTRRTAGGPDEGSAPDVELVPRPWANRETRAWASVALGAWVAVALLPAAQTYFSGESQRATANASISASETTTLLHASGLVEGFRLVTLQRVAWVRAAPYAQRFVAPAAPTPVETRRLITSAAVEHRVAARAERIAQVLSRPPSVAAGVDPATVEVARATRADATARLIEQNEKADEAEEAGSRNNRVAVAILFAALATSLAALAGSQRHERGLSLAAAGVLALALLALLSLPLA